MKTSKIGLIIGLSIVYLLLKHLVPFGNIVVYPINLLVTFLHEFGHSFFAIITGGSVKDLQINTNGSGYAVTAGGIRSLVIMGGYIGSAIFGSILLYIGAKNPKSSEFVLYFLSGLMMFSGIFLFSSIFSTIILFLLAAAIIYIAIKTKYDDIVLMTLGTCSLLYIIEDFNVGPSSDLANFSGILPTWIWMILWLIIVLVIVGFTIKLILKE